MNFGIFRFVQGIVKLRGGTDLSIIGNSGDRLKVDASFSSGAVPNANSKLRYIDMNASNGGVERLTTITNATWVDVYNYTGSGYVFGFFLNIETFTQWRVRFLVDGEEIFDTNGILTDDVTGDAIYDLDNDSGSDNYFGITKNAHDRFSWHGPLDYPVRFASSIVIKVKRETGAGAKKFQSGIINLTKE